jgi:hypothetical protein
LGIVELLRLIWWIFYPPTQENFAKFERKKICCEKKLCRGMREASFGFPYPLLFWGWIFIQFQFQISFTPQYQPMIFNSVKPVYIIMCRVYSRGFMCFISKFAPFQTTRKYCHRRVCRHEKNNGINDTKNKHFNFEKIANPRSGNLKHKDFSCNFQSWRGWFDLRCLTLGD